MLKEAHTGAWEWHQDYGYWYDQGFLFPRMLSAFVSLDQATRENGCLSVLRGSHRIGDANLLHTSSPNESDHHRRSFITAYNALGNGQLKEQLSTDEICPVGQPNAVVEAASTYTR